LGLIAQEVKKVLPNVVHKDNAGYHSVDYGQLTPLLIEAVKELRAENASLMKRIETLEARAR
jgi:hypothetical protein